MQDIFLNIEATADFDKVLIHNRDVQTKNDYFDSEQWSSIKQRYLKAAADPSLLRTLRISIDRYGLMSVKNYQTLDNIDVHFSQYLLLLFLELMINREITFDRFASYTVQVDTVNRKVKFHLYDGGYFEGINTLNPDYLEIADTIRILERNFGLLEIRTEILED